MSKISIHNLRTYSHHGCLPEEARIGGHYLVDVDIETDFSEAAERDDLTKTVDYCDVFDIVKKEMALPSKLIEHAASRIADRLLVRMIRISQVTVRVTKIAPPTGGDLGSVSVTLSKSR